MKSYLENTHGVTFIEGEVTNINHSQGQINSLEFNSKGQTSNMSNIDKYIFCSGVGSISLCQMLGYKIPIYGIKGHSFNYYPKSEDMIMNTYNFSIENILFSQIGVNTDNCVRVSGYGDLTGIDTDIIPKRSQMLIDFTKEFLGHEGYDEQKAHHWAGLRYDLFILFNLVAYEIWDIVLH